MANFTSAILVLLSVVVGTTLASQAGVNAQLRTGLGSPLQAAFISFVIGTLVLGTLVMLEGKPWFPNGTLKALPWWAWLGGFWGV